MSSIKTISRAALLAGASFVAVTALCTPAAVAQAADEPSILSEVVVTVRKREETLKDVPVAATVVTAEVLERNNMRTIADIAAITPGLTINSDSATRSFISIRGVGTTILPSVQPGVGIFIDGIYQPNTSYLNNPAVDVDRIEVLRGPQGTLYGKNTLGGAINVITRQPRDVVEGKVSAGYTDGDNSTFATASISGPLAKGVLAGRIAVARERGDGFYTHTTLGGPIDPVHTDSVNGTLVFTPTETVKLTVNAYRNDVVGGDVNYSAVSGIRDYRVNTVHNVNNRAWLGYGGVNAKLEADLTTQTTLTAILAYDMHDASVSEDGDFINFDILRTRSDSHADTKTAELRLDTRFSETVSALVGVYALRTDSGGVTGSLTVPLGRTAFSVSSSKTDAWAVFGTLFWNITPDIEFTAGLRYDHDEREVRGYGYQSTNPAAISVTAPRARSEQEVQPRFTLKKRWSDDLMTYASIAKGFRGGGTNSTSAPVSLWTYTGDTVWTYELGAKLSAFDRRLSLNTAVFYNDYKNYIGNNEIVLGPTGALVGVDLNTGDVESYGFEAEAVARLTDAWTISGGLTLLHARVVDDAPFFAATGAHLTTDRLTFLPDWNFNIESSYVWRVGDDSDVDFRVGVVGKGERSEGGAPVPPMLETYYLTNASLTWRRGPLQLAVFGTNIFDEKYWETYIDGSALSALGLPFTNLALLGDGRRVGARVSYRF